MSSERCECSSRANCQTIEDYRQKTRSRLELSGFRKISYPYDWYGRRLWCWQLRSKSRCEDRCVDVVCAGGDKDDSRLSIHSRSRLVWLRIPRILYSIELLAIEFEARGRWRYTEKGCSGCEGRRGKRKNERRAWFVGVCVWCVACVVGGWCLSSSRGQAGRRETNLPTRQFFRSTAGCETRCSVLLRGSSYGCK